MHPTETTPIDEGDHVNTLSSFNSFIEAGKEEAPVRLTAEDRLRILDELAQGLIIPESVCDST